MTSPFEKSAALNAKRTILIVDDEKDITTILKTYLLTEGYRVHTAYNAETALAQIKKTLPSLILIDVMMPEMDGIQMKAELNKDKILSEIPVIFLTAKSFPVLYEEGRILGVDDYVIKPFDIKELIARIDTAIDRHEQHEKIPAKDALTGLMDANFFKHELRVRFTLAKRTERTFSIALIKIDSFEKITETYGKIAGDWIMREAAMRMRSFLIKNICVLARVGANEFGLIAQGGQEVLRAILSRLKNRLEEKPYYASESANQKIPVLIQIRSAIYGNFISTPAEMLESAEVDAASEPAPGIRCK